MVLSEIYFSENNEVIGLQTAYIWMENLVLASTHIEYSCVTFRGLADSEISPSAFSYESSQCRDPVLIMDGLNAGSIIIPHASKCLIAGLPHPAI